MQPPTQIGGPSGLDTTRQIVKDIDEWMEQEAPAEVQEVDVLRLYAMLRGLARVVEDHLSA